MKFCLGKLNRFTWFMAQDKIEDLLQCGYVALVEAAQRYDATTGQFSTYAVMRIRGAMLDFIRDESKEHGGLTRYWHLKEKKREAAGEKVKTREDRINEYRKHLWKQLTDSSSDSDPVGLLVEQDQIDFMHEQLVPKLTDSEAQVVRMRCNGISHKDIGETMNFSESRSCQLQQQAVGKMRVWRKNLR